MEDSVLKLFINLLLIITLLMRIPLKVGDKYGKYGQPLGVKLFIWLCLHNSIMVKEVMASKGLNASRLCTWCGLGA